MAVKTFNTLTLCSLYLGVAISPAFARQTTPPHDITIHSAPRTAESHPSPTPTTQPKQKCCRNDPFRIFVPPSEPVCCLIPLPEPRPDPHPADDLLPFEEWKARQLALNLTEPKNTGDSHGRLNSVGHVSNESSPTLETINDILIPVIETGGAPADPFVAEFVPIEGRFNYASLDCSARVHSSHPSMKSPSSILLSKKDKYMLAPCSVEDKNIVVELCDDIRVDTVQLANFEFFSGVFKDITISLAQTPDPHGPGWEIMGVYQAKNVRGVQTFRPFTRPHAFHRYIRIEFRTHYGKEYFCPVSLLRVYGLTQMEEWRMGEWKREWQVRNSLIVPTISGEVEPAPLDPTITSASEAAHDKVQDVKVVSFEASPGVPNSSDNPIVFTSPAPNYTSVPSSNMTQPANNSGTTSTRDSSAHDQNEPQSNITAGVHSLNTTNITDVSRSISMDSHAKTVNMKHSKAKSLGSVPTATGALRATHVGTPVPSVGGESIYRTIMNRLDTLERNSTLSLRYVEEQNHSVRQALRRLEEEVGRLKALTGREQHELQRSMRNVEKKQAEMEKRWDMMLEQINTLSEEVVLEKRLGIAQLCLLTVVLVFMALTRGSRAETHLLSGMRRRVDSGLGLGRGLHPRHHAQSKPSINPRPFSWTRHDRHSTGDTSHHGSTGLPFTPARSVTPPQVFGAPSGHLGQNPPRVQSQSPNRQTSKGVHFPQGMLSFPLSRPGNLSGVRRTQSLSLSSEQLATTPRTGRSPATVMKRLARTAHLHEIELEAQRRLRTKAEQMQKNNCTDRQDDDASDPFTPSLFSGSQHSNDHLASNNPGQSPDCQTPLPTRKDPLITGTFGRSSAPFQAQQPDNGAEWEDTDADLDGDDPMQELVIEENCPATRVPRIFSPPTPRTWSARRKGRGFSVNSGTAFRMRCGSGRT